MIEEKIKILGEALRGIWKSILVFDSFGGITKKEQWSVTFIYKNDYVETPGCDTPIEALDFAINMVNK